MSAALNCGCQHVSRRCNCMKTLVDEHVRRRLDAASADVDIEHTLPSLMNLHCYLSRVIWVLFWLSSQVLCCCCSSCCWDRSGATR